MKVTTSLGAVQGAVEGGVASFKGIPFATAARFQAPVGAEPWSGVLEATSFGPACPQGAGGATSGGRAGVFGGLFGPGEGGMDEAGCLNLNVWVPEGASGPLPVLVWIHGGAFRMGTAGTPMYDGSTLSRRGNVVVVSLNYRLGVLGFFHLPGIGVTNPGIRDQLAALEWVHREIAAFGGDPHDVTIFGESAGGKSVECLLAAPNGRGLFHRAICQSTYETSMDPVQAEATSRGVLAELGLSAGDEARVLDAPVDDLLAASSRQMLAASAAGGGLLSGTGGGGPIVDGDVIPRLPLEAVAAGVAADIPLMAGTTLDESRLFGAFMPGANDVTETDLLARLAPIVPDPSAAAAAYRSSRGEMTAADIWFAVLTDRTFRQHSIRLASAQSQHQPATYMYLFTWATEAMGGALRSCHALELPFVFGSFDGPLGMLAGAGDEATELSVRMQDAWLAFAKTGKPSTDASEWPTYDTDRRTTAVFGRSCEIREAPLEPERVLWSS